MSIVDDDADADGRRTDGRRLDGYTISSPCEPNGSGELKIKDVNEPRREKTCLRGFRPSPTPTGLWLDARSFGLDCSIHVAKTKALISYAVNAQLICAFVFAYANSRFLLTLLIFTKIHKKCLSRSQPSQILR